VNLGYVNSKGDFVKVGKTVVFNATNDAAVGDGERRPQSAESP
jgi:hypothetical protein